MVEPKDGKKISKNDNLFLVKALPIFSTKYFLLHYNKFHIHVFCNSLKVQKAIVDMKRRGFHLVSMTKARLLNNISPKRSSPLIPWTAEWLVILTNKECRSVAEWLKSSIKLSREIMLPNILTKARYQDMKTDYTW